MSDPTIPKHEYYRNVIWDSLTAMKYKERYYEHYFISATRWDKVIMSICLLASASSIAGWQIWDASPVICAVVLGIAQVVQAIRPILPFSIQISAIKHLLADGSALFVEYENEWLQLEALPDNDEKISRTIESHHRFSYFEIFEPTEPLHVDITARLHIVVNKIIQLYYEMFCKRFMHSN